MRQEFASAQEDIFFVRSKCNAPAAVGREACGPMLELALCQEFHD